MELHGRYNKVSARRKQDYCFLTENNSIATEQGLIKVSDYIPGMKIATKNGFEEPLEVITSDYTGEVVSIASDQLIDMVTLICDSQIFILHQQICGFEIIKCSPECKHVDTCNYPFVCTNIDYITISARDICVGQYLIIPKEVIISKFNPCAYSDFLC